MRKDLEFLKYWPWALFVPHFLFSSDELIYSDYISDVCVCVCVCVCISKTCISFLDLSSDL